ncbi:MAG: hypothetical protein ACYSYV_08560 [Planctomycetota bacterium]|jgi:hypothetical protein
MSRERQAEPECDLKKQSQFPDAQMNITSFPAGYYDDFAASQLRTDKANRSQFQNPQMQQSRVRLTCRRLRKWAGNSESFAEVMEQD